MDNSNKDLIEKINRERAQKEQAHNPDRTAADKAAAHEKTMQQLADKLIKNQNQNQ